MRIRKRFAPAISDLQLQLRSSPSDPQTQPPHQITKIGCKNYRSWVSSVHDKADDKIEQKEFGDDETWIMEANKNTTTDDIREIVNICNGHQEVRNRSMHPSSSCAHEEENNKAVPLKKRKGCFERSGLEETISSAKMKSKTNKKCDDHNYNSQDDLKSLILVDENETNINSSMKKKIKRGNVIMEGSRCSRMNGRGWRCHQPTLVGYSLCEHHLGKGRLRNTAIVRHDNGGGAPAPEQKPLMVTKKRTKVGVVKARSMSSLLSQI